MLLLTAAIVSILSCSTAALFITYIYFYFFLFLQFYNLYYTYIYVLRKVVAAAVKPPVSMWGQHKVKISLCGPCLNLIHFNAFCFLIGSAVSAAFTHTLIFQKPFTSTWWSRLNKKQEVPSTASLSHISSESINCAAAKSPKADEQEVLELFVLWQSYQHLINYQNSLISANQPL